MSSQDASLFLIDAHSICYRSFYAIKELSTSQGRPTNAVLGFVNTLRKILREYQPKYMAVCFDSPEKTLRAKKYIEYKIQRQAMPEPLIDQVKTIKEIVRAYRIPIFEEGGYEADDLIASLVDQYSKDLDIVVVSEDKDMFQLAGSIRTRLPYRRAGSHNE